MANVTPQSLNSLGLYELLAEKKKKKSGCLPCHCSHLQGGKHHPVCSQPQTTPLQHSDMLRGLLPAGATNWLL